MVATATILVLLSSCDEWLPIFNDDNLIDWFICHSRTSMLKNLLSQKYNITKQTCKSWFVQ